MASIVRAFDPRAPWTENRSSRFAQALPTFSIGVIAAGSATSGDGGSISVGVGAGVSSSGGRIMLTAGDASGGAKTTVSVAGSDWDIIRRKLKAVFGDRLSMRNRKANPRERARVNAVNSRIATTDGVRRC